MKDDNKLNIESPFYSFYVRKFYSFSALSDLFIESM